MNKHEEELLDEINSRLSELQTIRKKFEPDWAQAQEFVSDSVLDWSTLDTIPKIPKRYSSVPCNYLKTLGNGLVGYSISPNIVWFKLSLEQQDLLDEYGVKDFLEKSEAVMLAEFNRSNLYSEAIKFILDSATIGHGVVFIGEDVQNNRLRFIKQPANEIYMDVDQNNEVDTIFRTYLITVRNAIKFFGKDNVPKEILEDWEDKDRRNNKIEILEAVYPREDADERYKDARHKPYACIYIDRTHNKIISESGYDEFPYAVFSWDRYPGYPYGSSPAQAAISDIKGLNITKKTSWQIAQNSAEPPMKVSADIRQVNLVPKGFTYVTAADQVIEPIRTGENYPITLEVLQDMKQDIRDWFYVDFFLMLQQKTAQMTATEVMEMQGEKAATLSSLIVNLNGALQKIIQRSFNLLAKAGRLPPIPESLRGTDAMMKVDFVGPLSQAQKKYHTVGGTSQALQLGGAIMQLFPNAGDFIDPDALMKSALEGQGMPQNVIREDRDVQKIRETRAQQQAEAQQQAQQQQMIQNVMNNAQKLNEPIKQGSVMQQLNDQLAGGMNG